MTTPAPPTSSPTGPPPVPAAAGGMSFSVDGWDPSYGVSAMTDDVEVLDGSQGPVDADVEIPAGQWALVAPPDPATVPAPPAVMFVDGVRRIDARAWIDDRTPDGSAATTASLAICASYAAGVVCCCAGRAHLVVADPRRGLFTVAAHATDIDTRMGRYIAVRTVAGGDTPVPAALSNALQRALATVELTVAIAARGAVVDHVTGDPLLVIDGPLRNLSQLPNTLGFVKTHRTMYLPDPLQQMVGRLGAGERTPVFAIGGHRDRFSWYLRLPCPPAAPWAGIVRIEAAPELSMVEVLELAALSQAVLPRFASMEYKDARAPQNLVPIAGLESTLRHRLADPRLLMRALRAAAA